MSDLQLALLGVGVVVIAGVVAYNALQERRARQRAERAFGGEHADVLLDERREPTLGDLPQEEPIEPSIGRIEDEAPEPSPERDSAPAGPGSALSERIDTVATILADVPVPHEALEALLDTLQAHATPVHVEGMVGGRWQPVEGIDRPGWRDLRAGLQLASRSGPVAEEEIAAFDEAIANFTDSVNAVSQREAPAEAAARARELDRFCADADIEVAVNVVGQFGATFALARVKALALEHGLSETGTGELVSRASDGSTEFTVRRLDRPGARPDASYATGLTLGLDLPHVGNPSEAFNAMVAFAESVCATLGGEMVDDNRKPLSAPGIAAIRRQLEDVVRQMEAHGIPAGGALARRLFA
jgi:hypothetical protein